MLRHKTCFLTGLLHLRKRYPQIYSMLAFCTVVQYDICLLKTLVGWNFCFRTNFTVIIRNIYLDYRIFFSPHPQRANILLHPFSVEKFQTFQKSKPSKCKWYPGTFEFWRVSRNKSIFEPRIKWMNWIKFHNFFNTHFRLAKVRWLIRHLYSIMWFLMVKRSLSASFHIGVFWIFFEMKELKMAFPTGIPLSCMDPLAHHSPISNHGIDIYIHVDFKGCWLTRYTVAKTPSKSAAKSSTKKSTDNKKRRKRRMETFSSYIYKVLKQVHPDVGISRRAMEIMNSFVNDTFDRLANEALRLSRYANRATLTSREIQTSVRLLLPGELSKHAISEGSKAIGKFTS